jgi:uncharacterized protein YbjT (DUF2867 family)
MSIVVTTPTGHIGSVIVDRLLEAGRKDVAVIVRDPARLKESVRGRVTAHQGDLSDKAFVQKATEGAEVLFWLTPPTLTPPDWKAEFEQSAEAGANAVRANRIPYVVNLSSMGADRAEGRGPISYLQIVENALAATGANVLQLRPGFFYENFLPQVEPIKNQGSIFLPIPPETRVPLIATRDIGERAANRILAKDWTGVTILGLHGPADPPTFGEAATIIGDAIGKQVRYVQIPIEAMQEQFRQMGASESFIQGFTAMETALGRGLQPAEPRTPETTTPTTLFAWAREVLKPLVA